MSARAPKNGWLVVSGIQPGYTVTLTIQGHRQPVIYRGPVPDVPSGQEWVLPPGRVLILGRNAPVNLLDGFWMIAGARGSVCLCTLPAARDLVEFSLPQKDVKNAA